MENKKETDIFTKTTKLTLVVYFPILGAILLACLFCSGFMKQWSITYGFLVCLLPCLTFVFISAFIPIERVITSGKKRAVFGWTMLYILKYAIIFVVPILCTIYAANIFNKWVMFTMTLVAPIVIFIIKLITTYSSKNKEKDEKTPINTIKF